MSLLSSVVDLKQFCDPDPIFQRVFESGPGLQNVPDPILDLIDPKYLQVVTTATLRRNTVRAVFSRAHSFGHFEKCVLFNSRTFTSRLKSAGSEKREVGRFY
jgi:hypothetical protein